MNKLFNALSGSLVGTFSGLMMGIIALIVGGLLTSTIIGAIIGIPLMLAGVFWIVTGPFTGAFGGFMTVSAPCPYCQTKVMSLKTKPGVTCRGCKQRIIIREGQFHKIG